MKHQKHKRLLEKYGLKKGQSANCVKGNHTQIYWQSWISWTTAVQHDLYEPLRDKYLLKGVFLLEQWACQHVKKKEMDKVHFSDLFNWMCQLNTNKDPIRAIKWLSGILESWSVLASCMTPSYDPVIPASISQFLAELLAYLWNVWIAIQRASGDKGSTMLPCKALQWVNSLLLKSPSNNKSAISWPNRMLPCGFFCCEKCLPQFDLPA